MKSIKGILSDIDGTLYFKGKPIPGAIETIDKLHEEEIKLLFFTNTDSKTPSHIYKKLKEDNKSLLTIVTVPDSYLVDQWYNNDLFLYTKNVVKCYSENRTWRKSVKNKINQLIFNIIDHCYFVGTSKSLNSDFFKDFNITFSSLSEILFDFEVFFGFFLNFGIILLFDLFFSLLPTLYKYIIHISPQ